VLCLTGTWDPVKVGAGLVEAFTTAPLRDRSDYRLLCLGGGQEHLVAPLLANPNVELRGAYRPEDLPGLLGDVDVGLAPSNFETFHRVTREYLLAGLPVIGARAFGILDVIRDGINGLLVDQVDPGALARAITRVLDDRALLDRLTQGAVTTRVRSLEDEADELAAIYDDLLAQMRGSVPAALPSARPLPFRRKHAAMR
jgi:glycosyltransferase involved in cell wall biosynthesis